MEFGLNRFKEEQISQDNHNQSTARLNLINAFEDVRIETQAIMSFWDWEFYRNDKILAIGEYRRRFNSFDKFPDFQFSKKKFNAMVNKGIEHDIPAYMFVEFNDFFGFFVVDGNPPVKLMRRRHEIRTEECVCIEKTLFHHICQLQL